MAAAPPSRVAASIKRKREQPDSLVKKAVSFADLGVDDWLCDALTAMQIRAPSEIQRACIPPILKGTCRSLSF